ncbi:MAG: DUF484 family protein [Paracoccus sp. (in: a-proteobacteria)]|nr:DUF484 family protein [Paracoccus sp. (in: a-proteobacteria)]
MSGADTTDAAGTEADGAGAGALDADLRARIIADPALLLDDRELMRAVVGAHDDGVGANVIDIRGRAMTALETRLERLESAHENVIAAAYENQSGTATIHRAVLSVLEPGDFDALVEQLETVLPDILRVDTLVLCIEDGSKDAAPSQGGALARLPSGAVARALSGGRRGTVSGEVILRRAADITAPLHGSMVRSESLIPLDLGPVGMSACLLMGSHDAARFTPAQGTDLLRFFGQVFRLALIGLLRR